MKDCFFLFVFALFVADIRAIFDANLWKDSGLGLGYGMGSVKWRKPHKGGHSEGSAHSINYSMHAKIGPNLGKHLATDKGKEDFNNLQNFFKQLASKHSNFDMNEIPSGDRIGIGSGEGSGIASGKRVIFGEGIGIGRNGGGGLGIGHGRGVFVDQGGFKGHGRGVGIGFALGNAVGHGRSPDLTKLLQWSQSHAG